MGSGPTFNWTQPPLDSTMSPQMAQWATAVNSVINTLIGQVYPPVAPQVSAAGRNASVLLSWNEVSGASTYRIYQNNSDTFAGSTLVGSVPSNQAGSTNSFLVGSLPDMNTRYFFVQPITGQGQSGSASSGIAGAASSVPLPSGTVLGQIPDGDGFNKVKLVSSSNQTTSGSYQTGSISNQVTSIITTFTNVTTAFTQMNNIVQPVPSGGVIVFASGQLYNTGASASQFRIQIYKGDNTGSLMFDTGTNGPNVPSGTLCVPWSAPGLVDASPASSQKYSIYALIAAGTGQMDNILLTTINIRA